MNSEDGPQYHPFAFPLSFSPTQAFGAGLNCNAPVFEAIDWTPWENGDGGGCIPPQGWTEAQHTFSTIIDFGKICNDGSTALDKPAFTTSQHEINIVAAPAYLDLSKTSSSTRHPLVADVHMTAVLDEHSQMEPSPLAARESPEQTLRLRELNRHPNIEDWEFYRPIFTRLYCDENRTLKDVMSIMKNIYGFNATGKMYKKRINNWQLFKNQKAAEKEQIVKHLEVHRKVGVDLGQPMLRGREVKEHKIARYVREKRRADCLISKPSARDRDVPVSRPLTRLEDVRSVKRARMQHTTSRHAISFSHLKDPTKYQNTESLLIHMDQYFSSKLEKNPRTALDFWLKSSVPSGGAIRIQYIFQGRDYTCAFQDFSDICSRYFYAIALFRAGRTRSGWKLIHEAAEMIRPCLLQEDPSFVRLLLEVLVEPGLEKYAKIEKLLLDLIAGMTTVLYGERHPISKLCCTLNALHGRKHVIYLARRKLLDTFDHHLGNDHYASLHARLDSLRSLGAHKTHDEAKQGSHEIIRLCELARGRGHFLTRYSLYRLACLCYNAGEFPEAADILVDVLERGKHHGEIDKVNIISYALLGFIHKYYGNYGPAEHYLWIGLSGNIFKYGPQESVLDQTYVSYQELVGRQKPSKVAFRGRMQSPGVPGNAFDGHSRHISWRRANSLSGEYSLHCPCSEPSTGHTQALKVRCSTSNKPLRNFSRKRAHSLPRGQSLHN